MIAINSDMTSVVDISRMILLKGTVRHVVGGIIYTGLSLLRLFGIYTGSLWPLV